MTHWERGVLYPGRLDHHLFVLHHNHGRLLVSHDGLFNEESSYRLLDIALRREFADLNPTILLEGIICGASTTIEGRSKLPRF